MMEEDVGCRMSDPLSKSSEEVESARRTQHRTTADIPVPKNIQKRDIPVLLV